MLVAVVVGSAIYPSDTASIIVAVASVVFLSVGLNAAAVRGVLGGLGARVPRGAAANRCLSRRRTRDKGGHVNVSSGGNPGWRGNHRRSDLADAAISARPGLRHC